jgi:hypothetical protein
VSRARLVVSLLAVLLVPLGGGAVGPGAAEAAPPTPGVNAAGVPAGAALDEALATGAREVRMFLLWRDLEPTAGRLDPGLVAAYTDIVARLGAEGVRPNFVFTTAPAWASGSANPHAPPRDPADYASALARFAALPGIAGRGIAYEVWNEEDADEWWAPRADPVAYAALLKAAAPALRAADPSAEVVLGPLTGSDFPWLERLYGQGVQGSFDAAAVHLDTACLVTGPATFFRDAGGRISQYVFLGVREVLATMRAHGDAKPLRVTEFGWSSTQSAGGGGPSCERGSSTGLKPSGVTPADQATFLAQGYHCLAQEPGIEAATWFTLRDATAAESPLDELRHYGLLGAGGAHKPAWDAFRAIATGGDALTGLCGDFSGPSITVVTPKVGQRYAGSLLISASATDAGDPRRITFAADGKVLQNFGDGLANGKVMSLDWQGARGLSPGTHTITVSAVDAQGNEGRQDVQVRKVSPTELVAIGPARFTLKGVRCTARGRCTLTGRLLSPAGSPLPGKVQAQWQWRTKATKKHKARWKTLHKALKPAGKPFAVRQQLRRSGSWRVRVRYLAPKPLKASSSPWAYFTAKAKKKAR